MWAVGLPVIYKKFYSKKMGNYRVDKTALLWYPVSCLDKQNTKNKKDGYTMDYITVIKDGQEVKIPAVTIGEVAPQDKRYDWKGRRERTMTLEGLYGKAGYPDYAARVHDCATFLQFNVYQNGERKLKSANFCKLRLCPMCIGRRAKRSAWKLSKVLDMVEQEHKAKFIFLTLTMENVDGEHLGQAIKELCAAWYRFVDQRQIERSLRGWFRAIEITRGDDRWHKNRKTGRMEFCPDNGYNLHLHAIGAVDADYFSKESRKSGKYLNQSDLIERWQKALRVDYKPSVRISTAKSRRKGGGVESASLAAAKEAAKYPVKDEEYIDSTLPEERAVEIVRDYTEAMYRRRLTAFGGWMKDAAKKLDAENLEGGDLVHVDDDAIREDLLVMVESYNWHFGAGDYILTNREINPLNGTIKERP